jgi:hypothetical protein
MLELIGTLERRCFAGDGRRSHGLLDGSSNGDVGHGDGLSTTLAMWLVASSFDLDDSSSSGIAEKSLRRFDSCSD